MVALRAAAADDNDVMLQSLIQASAKDDVNRVNVDLFLFTGNWRHIPA